MGDRVDTNPFAACEIGQIGLHGSARPSRFRISGGHPARQLGPEAVILQPANRGQRVEAGPAHHGKRVDV